MNTTARVADCIRVFLAGDVMLGRGIDQILPHPGNATIFEGYLKSAVDYVELAERRSGAIPRRAPYAYVWGDLLDDLAALDVDLRLINLETAITTWDKPDDKGINYRMNPANIGVLTAAGVDACVLANNHAMDWGREGLVETLKTLKSAGISTVGAGHDRQEAARPLVAEIAGGGRVLVLAFGCFTSGVPARWAAGHGLSGVNLLPGEVRATVAEVRARIEPIRRPADVLVISIHWGLNWGYDIPAVQRRIAHALIDEAGADAIFGHSSHHPKAIENHNGKLILYGCGDLINDYEGIGGKEAYRPDLGLGYIVDLSRDDGTVKQLITLPYQRRQFRLARAGERAVAFLEQNVGRA